MTDSEGNKYFGLGMSEDFITDIYSVCIQKPGTMTQKKFCYYTSYCEEPLPDDTYEILFLKQYQEKPFHAVMRNIFTRSVSFIEFVNAFVENGGI